MPRKSKGGGGGGGASSSTTMSATASSHIALNNKFALLLDSDEDMEAESREQKQKDADNAPTSKEDDEKGTNRDTKDEKVRSSSSTIAPLVRPSRTTTSSAAPPPTTTTSTTARTTATRAAAATTTTAIPTLRRPLFFLDLEMTGLDPESDSILEIAVVATDGDDLDKRCVGPSVAIRTPKEKLAAMNAWCVDQHGRSGLTERCSDPARSVPHEEAERMVCDFVKRHRPPPRERTRRVEGRKDEQGGNDGDGDKSDDKSDGNDDGTDVIQDKIILAGNSIHTDLSFIRKHMPNLASLCSYRLVDVSCLAELARRWAPAAFYSAPEKRNAHEALKDVEDSIEELKYYRRVLFKSSSSEVSRAVAKYGGPRRGR